VVGQHDVDNGVSVSSTRRQKKAIELIEINDNLCKGCDICIEFCPTDVFRKSDKLNRRGYYLPVVARLDECTVCRLCELLCPELAIVLTEKQASDSMTTDAQHDGK
jgi:2-oxoglutarate ferredoxin oxidoreductase subunit delta